MRIEDLRNKQILILGLAREGINTFVFLRKLFPKQTIGIGDRLEFEKLSEKAKKLIKKDGKIIKHLGKDYLKSVKSYGVVIKSPGIPLKTITLFLSKNQILTSQTEIFFANCPGEIIGVTGTKGKSTTASLIHKILKEGKIKAHLIGNIGKPVLSFLFSGRKRDVYVYELSSHQLATLTKSPHIAVFLNIYPEHLDYYRNFREYALAKANIYRYQTKKDFLVFNQEDKIVREFAQKSKAKRIPFSIKNIGNIIKIKDIPLKGEFNLYNVAAAITVGKIYYVPDNKIAKAIKEFKPLAHRLELVGTFKGITFYNDSMATIPEATVSALKALGKEVETLITGGLDRGVDFENLAKEILRSQLKTIIFFPTTGQRIWNEIKNEAKRLMVRQLPLAFFVDNMREAVKLAYQHTKRRKICLLSSSSASFNLFKDFKERGNLFKKYVKELSST